ncbi:hypothetical protein G4B88_006291 [Cannabis sativa]|uniref:mRNA export factor GLE1 n=1 Tax=Cannabis sativa TaxID=3483 RepID=A0A7J6ICJ5_CANSA|nr:hypothetical protein G4B88_006291 [Cannabis sativa]
MRLMKEPKEKRKLSWKKNFAKKKPKQKPRAKLRAEETNRAAMEAQQRATKEAVEMEANEASSLYAVQKDASGLQMKAKTKESELRKPITSASAENKTLGLNTNKDYVRHERNISKLIRQITGTNDVKQRASELVKILKNPAYPQSISAGAFARKVVSHCGSPGSASFACGYVLVVVTQESAFESKEAYCKTLGFREDKGKIENVEDYLIRLESYMKLYGALVQLAGYALFKRYKSQFRKILSIISDNFLNALRSRENPALDTVIAEIQSYIEDNKFLEEPEERSLEMSLLSSVAVPDQNSYQHTDPQNSYQHSDPRNSYSYQRNDPRNSKLSIQKGQNKYKDQGRPSASISFIYV